MLVSGLFLDVNRSNWRNELNLDYVVSHRQQLSPSTKHTFSLTTLNKRLLRSMFGRSKDWNAITCFAGKDLGLNGLSARNLSPTVPLSVLTHFIVNKNESCCTWLLQLRKHGFSSANTRAILIVYLHFFVQGAEESVDLWGGGSTGWHPSQLLLGPEHPAGAVSPQSAHTGNKHKSLTCCPTNQFNR